MSWLGKPELSCPDDRCWCRQDLSRETLGLAPSSELKAYWDEKALTEKLTKRVMELEAALEALIDSRQDLGVAFAKARRVMTHD
jgi:hypothetical protein